MATKSVATIGDVTATPGTKLYPPATAGSWTAGLISYSSYPRLKSRGTNVISQATCTFSFAGTKEGAAVAGTETVTLRAKSTVLQKGLAAVIVDGDSETGIYGNKLAAGSSEPLKTE
jgi:hypothetical protein